MVPLIAFVGLEEECLSLANAVNSAYLLKTTEKLSRNKFVIRSIKEQKDSIMKAITGESSSLSNLIINRRFDKAFGYITESVHENFGTGTLLKTLLKDYKSPERWIIPDITNEEEIINIKRNHGIVISIGNNELSSLCDALYTDIPFTSNKDMVFHLMERLSFWDIIGATHLK